MQAGDFQIAQLEGSLEATVTPGIGTLKNASGNIVVGKPSASDATTKDPNVTNYLVDASFDSVNKTAWKLSRDAENTYDSKGTLASPTDGWIYKTIVTDNGDDPDTTANYYIAVTWTIRFTYTFSANETGNVGIYLDFTGDASKFERTGSVADQTGDKAKNAKKGFRIAFVSDARKVVWGDLADDDTSHPASGSIDNYSYISGTATGTETEYANINTNGTGSADNQANFITAAYGDAGGYAKAVDGGTDNLYRGDRITTIEHPASGDSKDIDVTCVAWFEGCDLNVVNGTALQTVKASMKFYSRLD